MPHIRATTLLALCALAPAAAAQTVIVDTVFDAVDFGGGRTIDDLPGPDGRISFREALIATDNTPGPQTVAFAIPIDQFYWSGDKAMLENDGGTFVVHDDETIIDFTTQTDFTGDGAVDTLDVLAFLNAWSAGC